VESAERVDSFFTLYLYEAWKKFLLIPTRSGTSPVVLCSYRPVVFMTGKNWLKTTHFCCAKWAVWWTVCCIYRECVDWNY